MCHDRLLGADEARRHLVRRQMFSSYLALPLTFSPSGATRASVQVHQHAVGRNESGNRARSSYKRTCIRSLVPHHLSLTQYVRRQPPVHTS